MMSYLSDGGDDRLVLGCDGRNPYGFGVVPDPAEYSFGSSTASTLSAAAFEYLTRHYDGLGSTNVTRSRYAETLDDFRCRLARLTDCDEGSGIVFAPSGTDLHLVAVCLTSAVVSRPLSVVTIGSNETGSRVAAAVAARHFSSVTAHGVPCQKGARIAGGIRHVEVALRSGSGCIRDASDVDADTEAAVADAIRAGRHVLIVMADQSKSGLIGPSLPSVLECRSIYPGRVDVLVDACQARLTRGSFADYLRLGFMVALTGSKFLGGPSFSGALLVPPRLAGQASRCTLPRALQSYCNAAEWPRDWRARECLPDGANLGLMIRWAAALFEWDRLSLNDAHTLAHIACAFVEGVRQHASRLQHVEIEPVPALERVRKQATARWDEHPTILPLIVRGASGERLNLRSLTSIHRALAQHRPAIRLGQPVVCTTGAAREDGILRLCLSAPLMVEAAASDAAVRRLLARACVALDAVEDLARGSLNSAAEHIEGARAA